VISTKRSDPWVLEFVVSGTIDNNQWENYVVGFKYSPLKQLNQIKPNLAGMVPAWFGLIWFSGFRGEV
jgi:hypothetical protein